MLITRILLMLALGLGLLAGPSPAQEGRPPAPTRSQDRDNTSEDRPTPPDDARPAEVQPLPAPEITLVEPGESPRAIVRYAPKAGSTERTQMTIDMTTEQTAMGMSSPPTVVPPLALTFRTTVKAADVGSIRYESALVDAEVTDTPDAQPGMADRLRRMLNLMRGMTMTVNATDQGIVQSVATAGNRSPDITPMDSRPNIERSFMNAIVPFPEEPIGRGASWTVTADVDAEGMTIEQTTTYTLERVDGDDYVLRVKVSQSADEQEIQFKNLPPNMKLRLMELDTEGSGSMTVRLGQLTPRTADLRTQTKLNARIEPNQIAMLQNVDARTQFEPAEAPAEKPSP